MALNEPRALLTVNVVIIKVMGSFKLATSGEILRGIYYCFQNFSTLLVLTVTRLNEPKNCCFYFIKMLLSEHDFVI